MADEIGPVPPGALAGARGNALDSARIWFNRLVDRAQRDATTLKAGSVKQAAAVADLNQTIGSPPTQAEVQAISDKVDELMAAQRTAGQLET